MIKIKHLWKVKTSIGDYNAYITETDKLTDVIDKLEYEGLRVNDIEEIQYDGTAISLINEDEE